MDEIDPIIIDDKQYNLSNNEDIDENEEEEEDFEMSKPTFIVSCSSIPIKLPTIKKDEDEFESNTFEEFANKYKNDYVPGSSFNKNSYD